MVFLVAENENRQLEDLPQADFGRVHENISFVGKEKVNNWEFCEKKATPIVCFCNGWTLFFILSFIADALYNFFLRNLKPIISFFKKSTFLPSKGLLHLHDKQNNRWSLADMELLFSCLSRYQEIITVYILLLDTLLVRCSRSRDNKLNIQREILYQSAPKYYCLFIEWVQNSRVCHTASIQNPLKVTIFNEFQCVTVARSLSDRFSYSPTIIDCWPQKRLLMNVKPSNLLISTPVNCISEQICTDNFVESRLLLKQ